MKKVTIVVPVYYNEQSLPLLFIELLKIEEELKQLNLELELIFVDDGSGDGSFNALMEIKRQREQTKVIKLTRNFGSIQAFKTGVKFTTGDCFMLLSADLQDPPRLIIELVNNWLKGEKYVVCARNRRDDPASSKFLSSIYYKLLSLLVVKDYPKGGYDLALMDKIFLPYIQNSSKNINTALYAYWLGFKPHVIYYDRVKRVHGKSRWTFGKKFKYFLDSLLGFSFIPIRVISSIGLVVSLVSFGYGILVVTLSLLGKMEVRGFAAIATLLSFLLGLVLLTLGLIGEYIWRILDEVNKRPDTVIETIL